MVATPETEDTLKLLIFNLCREIKQILIAVLNNESFTSEVSADEHLQDKAVADKWLVIS